MDLRQKLRKFIGVDEIAQRQEIIYWDVQKIHQDLEELYDAETRMRALIVGEFGKMQPASAAFIDAIFKENRDRLDIIMTVLDSFREQMRESLVRR